jgi:hypothetical protein
VVHHYLHAIGILDLLLVPCPSAQCGEIRMGVPSRGHRLQRLSAQGLSRAHRPGDSPRDRRPLVSQPPTPCGSLWDGSWRSSPPCRQILELPWLFSRHPLLPRLSWPSSQPRLFCKRALPWVCPGWRRGAFLGNVSRRIVRELRPWQASCHQGRVSPNYTRPFIGVKARVDWKAVDPYDFFRLEGGDSQLCLPISPPNISRRKNVTD